MRRRLTVLHVGRGCGEAAIPDVPSVAVWSLMTALQVLLAVAFEGLYVALNVPVVQLMFLIARMARRSMAEGARAIGHLRAASSSEREIASSPPSIAAQSGMPPSW